MTENTTRAGQLEAALKTAIAASQVAYALASRLADRVTAEEARGLLADAMGRRPHFPIDIDSLRWIAQHGADEFNLPVQCLAQRIIQDSES